MNKLAILLLLVFLLKTYSQEAEDATYLQMRRTACLVLSRYHSNTQKEVIESAVQSLPATDQNKYINKLYAVAVLKCEESISQSEVQEVSLTSFSSTSPITPTSIPPPTSTSLRELTTSTSLPTWIFPRSKRLWLSSPRSSTRRCRSSKKSERPRKRRKPAQKSATR
jgi:hypothetical protein